MTCASCVRRVEKKLNAVPGASATVNLPLHSAQVTTDGTVDPQTLIETIAKAGYGASLAAPDEEPAEEGPNPLLPRLILAAALSVPVVLLSMLPHAGVTRIGWLDLHSLTALWIVALLTAPVAIWAAWPFHRSAALNLRHGGFTMDTLVSLGVSAAFLSSLSTLIAATARAAGGAESHHPPAVYFESAAVIVAFLLAGRVLEQRATAGASAALRALVKASPSTALLIEREGLPLDPTEVPAASLRPGDVVRLRPGDLIPADGALRTGRLSVDTSSMTGESLPRAVEPGQAAHAGGVVLDGTAELAASHTGRQTQLARIGQMVGDAQSKKARIARLADRVSGVFVPVVLVLAALTLAGWWVSTGSFTEALSPAVAVLVIACPCALGLATPVGLVAGTGRAAQLGIYVSSPQALERSSRLGAVLFDKTGTLTSGRMRIESAVGRPQDLDLAAALESRSAHPIAQAIAASRTPGDLEVTDVSALPDGGLRGTVAGHEVLVGSPRALASAGICLADDDASGAPKAHSIACVAVDGALAGRFLVADAPREDAAATVARLQRRGLAVYMLTGDHSGAAQATAQAVGIPAESVRSGLLPADKVSAVEELQARHGQTVMVGDGLNDAAALATADVGISLSSGTEAAQGAADVTILGESLGAVVVCLDLAKATFRVIRSNLAWAFAYNVIGIPVAAAGLLSPMFAGGAMALSSVLVVANSLRLRRWRPKAD